MSGAADPAEKLDHLGVPPGDVDRDLFEDRNRAFATPVVDRLGDVQPLAARVEAGHQPGRQQVANIGDDPVVTGLDRLIVPQPIDAAPQDRGLAADAVDQLAQRTGGAGDVGVQRAVDFREEAPQLVRVKGGVVVGDSGHVLATIPVRLRCAPSFSTRKYFPAPGSCR
jgi:hypothetical protein